MNRPLVISDCDEVLLHMIGPFKEWLDETQGIDFDLSRHDFVSAMRRRDTGELVPPAEIWPLLETFFDSEMERQTPVAGALDALEELAKHADVVVLTNLTDRFQEARTRQLAEHGIHVRVYTNQGPKGPALKAIIDEFQPSRAVFIDDLAQHHGSVAELAPDVFRLHLCGEPRMAPNIACAHAAGHAHARIDTWAEALPWLLARLKEDDE